MMPDSVFLNSDSAKQSKRIMKSLDKLHSLQPSAHFVATLIAGRRSLAEPDMPVTHP